MRLTAGFPRSRTAASHQRTRAAHLADSKVVKAFNNIYSKHLGAMQRPAAAPEGNTLTIAADNEVAKRQVSEFIEAIGYDVFDTGSLADSCASSVTRPPTPAPTRRTATSNTPDPWTATSCKPCSGGQTRTCTEPVEPD